MTETPRHQMATEVPAQQPKTKQKAESPQRRRNSRSQCLITPRPYEAIYHEQGYLTGCLQKNTRRIEDLIKQYSAAQAQLHRGAEGKTRRRLRKLQNLLRCKLDEASEQERVIFSRMGELYMEHNSRYTWERARSMPEDDVFLTESPADDVVLTESSADDEGGAAAAPVTPCPSFSSSDDCSVASSVVPVPPVYTADPAAGSYATAASVGHAQHTALRCLPSDYLETVPEEETEDAPRTPTTPGTLPVEGGGSRSPYQECYGEPEFGSLDYYYVQHDAPPDDGEGSADESDESSGRESLKVRSNRFSLPVMQFKWPEA